MLGATIKKYLTVTVMGLFLSSNTYAAVSQEVSDLLTKKLTALKVKVQAINESPVQGLYEVVSDGAIYYISENGQHLINGNVYDIDMHAKLNQPKSRKTTT